MGEPGAASKSVKMWVWIVAAAVVVVYLVTTSIRATQLPYVNAAELVATRGQPVRVAGKVARGGIESSGEGDVSIRFKLIDEANDTVMVEYTGVRPDAFKEGAQAVAEGRYEPARNVFVANLLQAKCPSKYEVGGVGTPAVAPPGVGAQSKS